MKKIIIMEVLFFGCNLFRPFTYEYKWKHDIYIENPEQIMKWIYKNIKYKKDLEDYWQTPQETYDLKTGDCEDFCILMMQLCHELGYETELHVYEKNNKIQHAIAKVGDRFYDVVANKKYKNINECPDYKETIQSLTYSITLFIAEYYHSDEKYINRLNKECIF